MQVVNVVDCGIRIVQTPVTQADGTIILINSHDYYLSGTPTTSAQWNGDNVSEEPFSMSSPWDYIFKSLIDIYGANLIGKIVTLDVNDPDGNVMKVR